MLQFNSWDQPKVSCAHFTTGGQPARRFHLIWVYITQGTLGSDEFFPSPGVVSFGGISPALWLSRKQAPAPQDGRPVHVCHGHSSHWKCKEQKRWL